MSWGDSEPLTSFSASPSERRSPDWLLIRATLSSPGSPWRARPFSCSTRRRFCPRSLGSTASISKSDPASSTCRAGERSVSVLLACCSGVNSERSISSVAAATLARIGRCDWSSSATPPSGSTGSARMLRVQTAGCSALCFGRISVDLLSPRDTAHCLRFAMLNTPSTAGPSPMADCATSGMTKSSTCPRRFAKKFSVWSLDLTCVGSRSDRSPMLSRESARVSFHSRSLRSRPRLRPGGFSPCNPCWPPTRRWRSFHSWEDRLRIPLVFTWSCRPWPTKSSGFSLSACRRIPRTSLFGSFWPRCLNMSCTAFSTASRSLSSSGPTSSVPRASGNQGASVLAFASASGPCAMVPGGGGGGWGTPVSSRFLRSDCLGRVRGLGARCWSRILRWGRVGAGRVHIRGPGVQFRSVQ